MRIFKRKEQTFANPKEALHHALLRTFTYDRTRSKNEENINWGSKLSEIKARGHTQPITSRELVAYKTYIAREIKADLNSAFENSNSLDEYIRMAKQIIKERLDEITAARTVIIPAYSYEVQAYKTVTDSGGSHDVPDYSKKETKKVPATEHQAQRSGNFEKQLSKCTALLQQATMKEGVKEIRNEPTGSEAGPPNPSS